MFRVGNEIWSMGLVNGSDDVLRRSDMSFTLGVTDCNTHCVYIRDDLSFEKFQEVLTHEITHVYAFVYDVDIPIEVEEIVCQFVALYGRDVITTADMLLNILYEKGLLYA